MKKILGLIASPRHLGNCDIMVKEVCRNIEEEHELLVANLYDYSILPCKGCYTCLFKQGACVLEDEFPKVFQALIEADAVIVAAPTYFLSANSSLKGFLERCLSCYNHIDQLWKKPALGIGVSGIEGKEGYTALDIESFFTFLLFENKKTVTLSGALPGEIFLDDKNKVLAKELAQSLFAPVQKDESGNCPLCGGTSFRFEKGNNVHCLLCSNRGTMTMAESGPQFHIETQEPGMFFSKEEALTHKEWLMSMKDRFIENKKILKKITIDYLKDGKPLS